MGVSGADLPGFGGSLVLSLVSLALVCLAAYGVLRWLVHKPFGSSVAAIDVLGRCHLEPRRSVYLLAVGGRCFLVGVGDGPMSLLAEIEPSSVPRPPTPTEVGASGLTRWLARFFAKGGR